MRTFHSPRAQRGAAALIVTMVLFFAMLLAAAYANRNLVFEQRTSSNQYRSTQAFEAAEAGLEWAQAQLNSPARIGADCRASTDAAAQTFRERFLTRQGGATGFTGNTWLDGALAVPLQATCVRGDAGWACSCPAQGHPQPAAPNTPGLQPAFALEFAAGGKPGIVKLVSHGCTSVAGACAPGSTSKADASARVEVALGLLPALGTAPAAPLTARGRVNTAAELGVHNPDAASGGLVVHAGAGIVAPLLRVTPPAGTPVTDVLAANDAALAALTPQRLFSSFFGLDPTGWKNQPTVLKPPCSGDCSAALASTVQAAGGNPMVFVAGDLVLTGPLSIGTPQQPVVLVVEGAARFDGAVRLHGVVYSASMTWNNTIAGAGALLRGALVTEGDVQGNGAPDLFYDAAVLAALKRGGSFARVPGSWRDF